MAEKNLLAYFHTPEQASGVAAKLKSLRAIDVSVDRFGKYPGEGIEETQNPLTGNIPSLGWLTLGGDFDRDSGILAAADVSASGMSDGGQGGPTGLDIVLSAVVDESIYEQARRVIEEGGGQI
ncbi:hypothetical protein [Paenibacillus hamazuiensis]|uniref:hypothetical protein n=1 Tax=Paenibacillus hamazuiensis TaxID=2936508 RepID=UPI00200FAEFD|nr:hypothetical protein [Paenibacillus hamazuiensis]